MKILDDLKIYSVKEYDYSILRDIETVEKKIKRGKRVQKRNYKNVVCAFDIETTGLSDIEHSFMYVWQVCIFPDVIVGRTWNEFKQFLLRASYYLEDNETLVFYVHNLSYEMHFLKGVFHFNTDDCFCVDVRKFLTASLHGGKIEFRCAYLHSNMSLALFTEKYEAKHRKLSGSDFDYSKTRYPDTPLSDDELRYCVYDVAGLCEAIQNEMKLDNDNIATVPKTSTGYVRRDIMTSLEKFDKNMLRDCLPDYETYCMGKEAFRGGNTHASRFYADKILEDVLSYDFSSQYPFCMMCRKFPFGTWYDFDNPDIEDVHMVIENGDACIFEICLKGVELKTFACGNPYIPVHKCYELENETADNGRVMSADSLTMCVTDIDYKIIEDLYVWDNIEVTALKWCRYGYLPTQITDVLKKYMVMKTELKYTGDNEILLTKVKNKFNGIYGLTAQRSVQRSVLFVDNVFKYEDIDEEKEYNKFLTYGKLSFMWGVWVTAHARMLFHEAFTMCGIRYIYGDTDSVKFLNSPDIVEKIDRYNDGQRKQAEEHGAFCDIGGRRYHLGVLERDAEYKKFKTLGAKKYCYVDKNDNLKITIAGVGKSIGAKELGTIDNFKIGFVFRDAGGTESVYNDNVDFVIERDGHKIRITDNLFIKDSSYTLGVTGDYFDLIRKCTGYGELI